ncbi:hypothetical protein EYF80_002644 [Liparis tanakae]|uniref:Uncharacterized protein n=1 Tax=Liparis tanakae TaxID=230148 RepID=A0A4Z2J9J7_9TELE|nr:hypothetical protein EYF80_002644 [Liparis tanakae]
MWITMGSDLYAREVSSLVKAHDDEGVTHRTSEAGSGCCQRPDEDPEPGAGPDPPASPDFVTTERFL